MKKMSDNPHSMKMMWGCVTVAVLAIALVANGFGAGAYFIIPCVLMMGAMMYMMIGSSGARGEKP